MTKFILTSILIFNSFLALAETVPVDPNVLIPARNAAKTLTLKDIKEILLHPTLRECMQRITTEAKAHDRRRGVVESAMWIIQDAEGSYSCEFWREELRVRGGFDFDGYVPVNTILSLHTHPKNTGGLRPSESDYNFNKGLGMIGLILSYARKGVSANYPGSKKYPRVISSKEFRANFMK